MTSAFSWQNCQPLPCFVLYSQAKFACYSRYLLTSYFFISVPNNEKDIFFGGVSSRRLQVFIELFNFSFFSLTGRGIDLDYCNIEWFALEMNRDHSVVLKMGVSFLYPFPSASCLFSALQIAVFECRVPKNIKER